MNEDEIDIYFFKELFEFKSPHHIMIIETNLVWIFEKEEKIWWDKIWYDDDEILMSLIRRKCS